MVAILDSSGQLACGGSLVDEWVVLVSANSISLSEDPKIDYGLEDIFPDTSNNIKIEYEEYNTSSAWPAIPKIEKDYEDLFHENSSNIIMQYEEYDYDTSPDGSPLCGQLLRRFSDRSGWRVGCY